MDVEYVEFAMGLQRNYDLLQDKDPETLYICTDTKRIYLGEICLINRTAEFRGGTLVISQGEHNQGMTGVVKDLVAVSQPADGTWNKTGSMTVRRIAGSGCVVWNSLVINGNFDEWDDGRFLPNGWMNGTNINSTYFNVGRIDGTHGLRLECKAARSNAFMHCGGQVYAGHTYLLSAYVRNNVTIRLGSPADGRRISVHADTSGRRIFVLKKFTTSGTRVSIQFANGVVPGDFAEISDFTMLDITAMFGEGNEPDADAIAALLPFPYYNYSAPTLLGTKLHVLKSVGYNLLEDGVALLAVGSYKVEGNYTSLQVKSLRGTAETPAVDSEGIFSCSVPAYLIVSGWDETTCVHIVGDGSRTGYESPWTDEITVSIATMQCHAEGSQESVTPFPYGLLAIGNIRDEIVTDDNGMVMTAFKRVGVRDHIASDDSDSTVVTDGTHTAYILAEEEIYYLDNPFKAVLKADGWGEEISVPATDNGTEIVIPSLPCRIEADYKGEAITSIDIDGDERDIHDKRISEADIDRWNTPSAQPSSSTPQMDGSASSGTEEAYARGDHRHPSDTTKADDNAVVHKSGQEIITGTKHFQAETMFDDTVYFNDGTAHGDVGMYSSPVVEDGSVVERRLMLTDEDQGTVRFGGVSEPKANTDAANKQYVDNKVGAQPDWEANAGPSSILHKPLIMAGEGQGSIVENNMENVAKGDNSHAEGSATISFGAFSHSEGVQTKTSMSSVGAHAEGLGGGCSIIGTLHYMGGGNVGELYSYTLKVNLGLENGDCIGVKIEEYDFLLFATIIDIDKDNNTIEVIPEQLWSQFSIDDVNFYYVNGAAMADFSHTEGICTIATNEGEHAAGTLNISHTGYNVNEQTIHSIGVGYFDYTSQREVRRNAQEVMRNGDMYIIGIGGYDGTNATSQSAKTLQEVIGDIETLLAAI